MNETLPGWLARAALLLVCGSASCSAVQPTVTLAELEASRLVLGAHEADGMLRVTIHLETDDGRCERLDDDVIATVDGEPIALVVQGGEDPGLRGPICTNAYFAASYPSPGGLPAVSQVVVRDASATLIFEVERPFERRVLVPREPGAQLVAGSSIAYGWSPASDVVDAARLEAYFVHDAEPQTDHDDALSVTVEDGNVVVVHVDESAPPGPGELYVDGGSRARVVRCEGVAECQAPHAVSEVRRTTIAAP